MEESALKTSKSKISKTMRSWLQKETNPLNNVSFVEGESTFQSEGYLEGFFTRHRLANLSLRNALLLSVLFNFLLIVVVLKMTARLNEIPVRVVVAYGKQSVEDYPIESIGDFGKDFIIHYTYWDHRTIEHMFDRIARFLSPKLHSKILANKGFKIRAAKEGGVSQRYEIMDRKTLQYGARYYVIFQGEMRKQVGGTDSEKTSYYFVVQIIRDAVLADNQHGIIVEGFLEGKDLIKLTEQFKLPPQKITFPKNEK